MFDPCRRELFLPECSAGPGAIVVGRVRILENAACDFPALGLLSCLLGAVALEFVRWE